MYRAITMLPVARHGRPRLDFPSAARRNMKDTSCSAGNYRYCCRADDQICSLARNYSSTYVRRVVGRSLPCPLLLLLCLIGGGIKELERLWAGSPATHET